MKTNHDSTLTRRPVRKIAYVLYCNGDLVASTIVFQNDIDWTTYSDSNQCDGPAFDALKRSYLDGWIQSQSYFTRAYAAWYGRSPSEDCAGTKEQR